MTTESALARKRRGDEVIRTWASTKWGKEYCSIEEVLKDVETRKTPADIERLSALLRTYDAESQRSYSAGQYFSACVFGAACLETALLMLCYIFKNEVETSSFYKKQKHRRNAYDEEVNHWTLEKLLLVAQELQWFPADALDSDGPKAEVYRKNLPQVVRAVRNLLHPGRCMRMKSLAVPDAVMLKTTAHIVGELAKCLEIKLVDSLSSELVKDGNG